MPLEEQLERLLEPGRIDSALDSLKKDLANPHFRNRIKRMAAEGLVSGHAIYGDKTCHAKERAVQYEKDCELRDWVVYHVIGGMAEE